MKLDIGCGNKKKEGFLGVDALSLQGVDFVMDVRNTPWPWADNSVDEVFCSHFVEHLSGDERITFFNELWRVLKPGATAEVITPNWSHACAYGDPTHKWPPMSHWYLSYLNKQWRESMVAHVGYTCDFTSSYGFSVDPGFSAQSQEQLRANVTHAVNVAMELRAVLTKRV
jgi:ubiquinone/menaquinone biosynthesis C-methylase UbiE